jgi:transcriptional antiterminator RfaH
VSFRIVPDSFYAWTLKMKHSDWFVLATHAHREAEAMQHLTRQSFRAYCPMIVKHIRHARQNYDAPRPLFPGYVFVAQESAGQRWRPLRSTVGVSSLLMSGEAPARLPAGFVESLKLREVNGNICRPETAFRIGQQVTIQGGAFDGLIGQIVAMREHDRILVLLDLLNRQTPVHIDAKRLA